jgi:hypothetical protein
MLNDNPGLIDRRFSALDVGTLRPLTPNPTPLEERAPVGLRGAPCEMRLPADWECGMVMGEDLDDEPGVGLTLPERGVLLSWEPARAMGASRGPRGPAGDAGTLWLLRIAPAAGDTARCTGPASRGVPSPNAERLRGDVASAGYRGDDGDTLLVALTFDATVVSRLSDVEVELERMPLDSRSRRRASASSFSRSLRAARCRLASAWRRLRATRSLWQFMQ